MRWAAISLTALALAGCSSAAQDAEKQYDIVFATHDDAAICAQAKVVQAAYLKEGNAEKYQYWKMQAGIYCMSARL